MLKFYFNNLFGKRETHITNQRRNANEEGCIITEKINQSQEKMNAWLWNHINTKIEHFATKYLKDHNLQDLKDANEKQAHIANDFDIIISGGHYKNLGQENPLHKATLEINMYKYSPYRVKTILGSSNSIQLQYNITNWNCELTFLPRFKLWRLDIPPYPSIPLNIELRGLYDHDFKRLQLSTGFILANIGKAECSLNVGTSPKIGLSGNMSFDVFYGMANLTVKNNAIKVVGAWNVSPDLTVSLASKHSREFETTITTLEARYKYSSLNNTLSIDNKGIISVEVGLESENKSRVKLQYNTTENRIGIKWVAGVGLGRKL